MIRSGKRWNFTTNDQQLRFVPRSANVIGTTNVTRRTIERRKFLVSRDVGILINRQLGVGWRRDGGEDARDDDDDDGVRVIRRQTTTVLFDIFIAIDEGENTPPVRMFCRRP